MNESDMKEVDFTYCRKCRHWIKPEDEEPCHECLGTPMNAYSRKPVRYEEDEKAASRGARTAKARG